MHLQALRISGKKLSVFWYRPAAYARFFVSQAGAATHGSRKLRMFAALY